MRIILALVLAMLVAAPSVSQVSGHLEQVDGKHLLVVWGTHHQRGHAHGYLLGENAKTVFEDYFLGFVCGGQASYYGNFRTLYLTDYQVDPRYQTEADAFILGARDAGIDLFNPTLGRDLDAVDILVLNAIVDLSQRVGKNALGCSSLSSWGSSTDDDPELAGRLLITRHMDWSRHPALTDNPALIVHLPAEVDEQRWLSLAYAGFMGALSGINESGLATFYHVGNVTHCSGGAPYQPILHTVRSGVERRDFDGDGQNGAADVVAAVLASGRSSGSIIHVVKDEGESSGPVVIECNNPQGVAVRDVNDNSAIPGSNLVATNHFRRLYAPIYCYRYDAVADSLTATTAISGARSWFLLGGAAGSYSSNLHAIQYLPSEERLLWATNTHSQPAYIQEPTVFLIDDLFNFLTDVATAPMPARLDQNYPNPFNPVTTIRFNLGAGGFCRLDVFDLLGQRVRTVFAGQLPAGPHRFLWRGCDDQGLPVSSGTYLYRLEAGGSLANRAMLLAR